MVIKLDKRYASGLTLNASYVLSKLLTDADSYDSRQLARRITTTAAWKSRSASTTRRTASNSTTSYELPFGKGKGMLNSGVMSCVLGGWRIGGAHMYASGYPLALTNGVNYNIFNGRSPAHITTYEGWVNTNDNPNWSGGERYFNAPRVRVTSTQPAGIQQSTSVLGQRDPVQSEGA